MAEKLIDAKGLRCPQPVLKIAAKMPEMKAGDILVVEADCPTFEQDVRKWCDRMKKTLLAVNTKGTAKSIRIQF
ncbi:MAG: sulfurtransferase TusA family protein [Acidobacteria bacterium]|nr:MAG: sulfurtransferase TusA family protein [Acidobacteriota bacterium]